MSMTTTHNDQFPPELLRCISSDSPARARSRGLTAAGAMAICLSVLEFGDEVIICQRGIAKSLGRLLVVRCKCARI